MTPSLLSLHAGVPTSAPARYRHVRLFPLARYFTRIGYHGPAEPTLEVLRQLHLLHPQAIPFENIDAYSGLGVSLDLARIADKMLARGRGGYCFEHNRLFQAVLEHWAFASRR